MITTIKDIAKRANVSIATVSRVMNGNDKVSAELRASVLDAMAELNYYPNSIARSLKTDTSMTIGIIVLESANAHLINLCGTIENCVFSHGYLPLLCFTNGKEALERTYLIHMLSRKVNGIVILTCGALHDYVADVSRIIPMVSVYRHIDHSEYRGDFVSYDFNSSAYTLTRHLLDSGHRKISILNGPQNISTGYMPFQGFRRAMSEFGITVEEDYPYRYDSDFSMRDGYDGCQRLLTEPDPPTALIATNADVLLGALHYCQKHSVRIPEDISVVGCIRPYNAELFAFDITCAIHDYTIMGERIAKLLLDRMTDKSYPNREVELAAPIHMGKSVKRI